MIAKIFIDSRHSLGPSNNFTITLPESLSFPKKTIARVAEACIPNSWYLIDERNDKVWVIMELNGIKSLHSGSLAHQHMDTAQKFAQAMETALRPVLGPSLTAVFVEDHNHIVITCSTNFYLPSEEQLHFFAFQGLIDYNFSSCNYILENLTGYGSTSVTATPLSGQWSSPSVDINRYHSVFIHSSLSDNQTIASNMNRTNILKKVSVTAPTGGKIFDSISTSHDYCDVSNMNVRNISFSLRDRDGILINLQGHSWSLSVVFDYA